MSLEAMMDLSIDIHTVPVDPKTSSLVEGCKLNVKGNHNIHKHIVQWYQLAWQPT